eukprot:gene1117-biopygen15272
MSASSIVAKTSIELNTCGDARIRQPP